MLDRSLAGIRVIDFSHVVAGPVCTMTLADLGADVVKVEPPAGELGRAIGPPWQRDESVAFLSVNRNKRGLCIDLSTTAGIAIARRLVCDADVVVESFRPDVMARFGLDYATLQPERPSLVYCSISAYGQTSPWRHRPGVDGIIQGVTGLMRTLSPHDGGPSKVSFPIADMITGYHAATAILAALRVVQDGGDGQWLDLSLYNSTLALQQLGLAFFEAEGGQHAAQGSAAPYAAPNEAFESADGWLMVAAYHPRRWVALCRLLDRPALLDDPRYADNASRVGHRDALHEALAPAFRTRSTAEWIPLLEQADVLCAPIVDYRGVVDSEPYRASGMSSVFTHPTAGDVRAPGFFAPRSLANAGRVRPAPLLGEHTEVVLAELGIASDDVARLIEERVVAIDPHTSTTGARPA